MTSVGVFQEFNCYTYMWGKLQLILNIPELSNCNFILLNILQDSSFSNQITFILHIQGVFSLLGRGFHQRVTLISSVPMTLDDVDESLYQVN